jgi:formylmethanofuran dehydrogenase subunit D
MGFCTHPDGERAPMPAKRFLMNAGRTSKQGQQINVGKDHAEYQAIVSTLIMHPDDMRALNVPDGGAVRVRSDYGEAEFRCKGGKVPEGMIFVPYGPPTCRLMGGGTDGTGMPTSKGWEVEVEPINRSNHGQYPQ